MWNRLIEKIRNTETSILLLKTFWATICLLSFYWCTYMIVTSSDPLGELLFLIKFVVIIFSPVTLIYLIKRIIDSK